MVWLRLAIYESIRTTRRMLWKRLKIMKSGACSVLSQGIDSTVKVQYTFGDVSCVTALAIALSEITLNIIELAIELAV